MLVELLNKSFLKSSCLLNQFNTFEKLAQAKKHFSRHIIIYAIRIIDSFHKIHYIKLGHTLYNLYKNKIYKKSESGSHTENLLIWHLFCVGVWKIPDLKLAQIRTMKKYLTWMPFKTGSWKIIKTNN